MELLGDTAEGREATADTDTPALIGEKALGNRVRMSVHRPDGSLYEYSLPTKPLGMIFTTEGPIELQSPDENH